MIMIGLEKLDKNSEYNSIFSVYLRFLAVNMKLECRKEMTIIMISILSVVRKTK